MKNFAYPFATASLMFLVFVACANIVKTPENPSFDLDRYLGKWYQVARIDYQYERGLDSVVLVYSLDEKGKIDFRSRGFNSAEGRWTELCGTVTPTKIMNFFKLRLGPLAWLGYKVAYVNKDYTLAIVTGNTHKHLWILSRTPKLDSDELNLAYEVTGGLGYDNSKLLFPVQ